MRQISIGTKVQYSRRWLRDTGNFTGPIPFAKGVVTELRRFGGSAMLATVDWADDRIPAKVNTANLNIIGRPEAY